MSWHDANKQVKDIYEQKFKWLNKEVKEDLRNWRDQPWSWIVRLNIVIMAILPKAIY